eukprot:m.54205 g.54205  ORF g.54205 m.54205 type:complete len:197 (-) comp7513_c0_seq1:4888-5478(-)
MHRSALLTTSRSAMKQDTDDDGVLDSVFGAVLVCIGLAVAGSFGYVLFYAALAPSSHVPTEAPMSTDDMVRRIVELNKELNQLNVAVDQHQEKRDAYYKERAKALEVLLPKNLSSRIRPDHRCGPDFLAPDGTAYGECDPSVDADPGGPCCRPETGWCGNVRHKQWGHCDCSDCVDFGKVRDIRKAIAARYAMPVS